jgi:uncharacterized membrane protein
MPNEMAAGLAILVIATITFASRLTGPILMRKVRNSPKVDRFLDALSVSVIAALVASALAQNGLRELAAVAFASFVMLRSNNAIWAMLTGIVVAAAWSFAAGGVL